MSNWAKSYELATEFVTYCVMQTMPTLLRSLDLSTKRSCQVVLTSFHSVKK